MLLSIVIINYNTFQLTCDCIQSIKETTHLEYEIILVDNNSKECAAEKFLEVFPEIKLISLKENVGFGRANNRGVEEARGKYVLLLNSDTIVHESTLDKTVGYLEQNPAVDILGCKVLLQNRAVQTTVIKDEKEYRLLPALKYLIKRNTLFVESRLFFINRMQQRKINDQIRESASTSTPRTNYYNGKRIGSLVGVFVLIKRNVYMASKGFDPDFFMYYEEIEWFVNRLRKYNIVYYPEASIMHYHGGSDIHKTATRQFFVSQFLFWYKMGYLQYFSYFLFILFEIPSRFLVRLIYGKKRASRDIPDIINAIPYFFKILRYSNKYGGRAEMLKLDYMQQQTL